MSIGWAVLEALGWDQQAVVGLGRASIHPVSKEICCVAWFRAGTICMGSCVDSTRWLVACIVALIRSQLG